jgi:DNA-directed RNA polymerase beta' subunit
MEDNIEDITQIDFEIWSNHSSNGISVAEPSLNGVLDNRLGITNYLLECPFCGETSLRCMGHFGHIEVEPVFPIGYQFYLNKILNQSSPRTKF